jgi:hypothetical protein
MLQAGQSGVHILAMGLIHPFLQWLLGFFPGGGQISGDMMSTTHLCVIRRLRMCVTVSVFFLFAIISCTEITLPFTSYVFYLQSLAFCSFSTHMMEVQIGWGHVVVHLVEVLRYKPEGRGFDSRWCHGIFSLT